MNQTSLETTPRFHEYETETQATAAPIVAACVAALLGAAGWAFISILTEYEIGFAAWGIGGLIGFATVKFGGWGTAIAGLAAVLTLVSIFLGKTTASYVFVQREVDTVKEDYLTPGLYAELQRDSKAYAELPSMPLESQIREFMLEYGYTESAGPEGITREELAFFHEESIPMLEEFRDSPPAFEAWQQASYEEFRAEFEGQFSLVGAVVDDLSAMDLLFAFLAISTAFGMISRAEENRLVGGAESSLPPVDTPRRAA